MNSNSTNIIALLGPTNTGKTYVAIEKITNSLVFLNCIIKSKKKIISNASGIWKILNYKIPGSGYGG